MRDGDDWTRIESARNIGEATLLRNVLQNAGIEVRLRGEHRPSIAGELPFPEAMIELFVRTSELAHARAVLVRANSDETHANATPQRCESCGEENPGNFGVCWKCGGALEVGAKATLAAGMESHSEPATAPAVPPRSWSTPAALLLGAVALAAGFFIGHRVGLTEEFGAGLVVSRWDPGGRCLEERWRDSRALHARHCDLNRNGVFEITTQYTRKGWLHWTHDDDDENGVVELAIEHGPEGLLSEHHDANQDSIVERIIEFGPSGLVRLERLDRDETGRFELFIETRQDGLEIRWFDEDENAQLDRREVWRGGELLRTEVDRGSEGFIELPR